MTVLAAPWSSTLITFENEYEEQEEQPSPSNKLNARSVETMLNVLEAVTSPETHQASQGFTVR